VLFMIVSLAVSCRYVAAGPGCWIARGMAQREPVI